MMQPPRTTGSSTTQSFVPYPLTTAASTTALSIPTQTATTMRLWSPRGPRSRSPRRFAATRVLSDRTVYEQEIKKRADSAGNEHKIIVLYSNWYNNVRDEIKRQVAKAIRRVSRRRDLRNYPIGEEFLKGVISKVLESSLEHSRINERIKKKIVKHCDKSEYDFLRSFDTINPVQFIFNYNQLERSSKLKVMKIAGGEEAENILRNAGVAKNQNKLIKQILKEKSIQNVIDLKSKIIILNKTHFCFEKGFDFRLLSRFPSLSIPVYLAPLGDIKDSFRSFLPNDSNPELISRNTIIFNGETIPLPDYKAFEDSELSNDIFFMSWIIERFAEKMGDETLAANLEKQLSYFKKSPTIPKDEKRKITDRLIHVLQKNGLDIINAENSEEKSETLVCFYRLSNLKLSEIEMCVLKAIVRHHKFLWCVLEDNTAYHEKHWKELATYCVEEIFPKIYEYDASEQVIPLRPFLARFNCGMLATLDYFWKVFCPSLMHTDVSQKAETPGIFPKKAIWLHFLSGLPTSYNIAYKDGAAVVKHNRSYVIEKEKDRPGTSKKESEQSSFEQRYAEKSVNWQVSIDLNDPFFSSAELESRLVFKKGIADPIREAICHAYDFQNLNNSPFADLFETKYVGHTPRIHNK